MSADKSIAYIIKALTLSINPTVRNHSTSVTRPLTHHTCVIYQRNCALNLKQTEFTIYKTYSEIVLFFFSCYKYNQQIVLNENCNITVCKMLIFIIK